MKIAMRRFPLFEAFRNSRIADGPVQPVERAHDVTLPVKISADHRVAQRHALHLCTELRDFRQVRQRDRRYPVTPVVLELDQAISNQARQGLAKGAETYIEDRTGAVQVD